ncbi:MAG: tetraacyldisaccharide 4'-kinase, partial [Candidatus Omnitrophica bacterium]|nr:tetraacyldisaccharide 4'-kinase [Candidatus Omnitrophota bacterium]
TNRFSIYGLKNKSVGCVSGIANPAAFEKMLVAAGLNLKKAFRFPDHHNYSGADIQGIISTCKQMDINQVITTEKDIVKLRNYLTAECSVQFYALVIRLSVKENETFFKRISRIY